jgi:murein DD-endopeptidase MepM/ murein hydrolase activator NlpD
MDEEGAMLGVGFAIDFHDSFGQLRSLDDLIGATAADAVRQFQKLEAASRGTLKLGSASAEMKTFGNAATREMASTVRATAQAEKAGEALVRQLGRQNAAFGKTTAEMREMKVMTAATAAERQGLSELANRLVTEEIAIQAKAAAAAEAAAEARVMAAQRVADAEAAAVTRANAMLAEQARLQATIAQKTGAGRTRATDGGATFSALAEMVQQEERAFQKAALAAQEAAKQQATYAAQASTLRAQLDPMFAAQQRFNQALDQADDLYRAGLITTNEYAAAQKHARDALQQHAQAVAGTGAAVSDLSRPLVSASGNARQFSLQMSQVGQQVMAGTSVIQALAIQLPDIAAGMNANQASAGKFATFLAGPWGIAATVAIGLAASFAYKLYDSSNALKDSTDKLKKDAIETEALARAKDRFKISQEGVNQAIREGTEATKSAIEAERSAAEQANITAKINLQRAMDIRTGIKDDLQATKERIEAQLIRARSGGQQGDLAAGAVMRLQAQLDKINGQLSENEKAIIAAQKRVQETRIGLAEEEAKRMADPLEQIKKSYDDQVGAAKAAARAQIAAGGTVTTALTGQLAAIERNRAAALRAYQDTERAAKAVGSGRDLTQFGSPIPGAHITSGFGHRERPTAGASSNHLAIDYAARLGEPILAAADGIVKFADAVKGYGNRIEIAHGGSTKSTYSHLSGFNVRDGQAVNKGDVIGYAGKTGTATGVHLHYEVLVNGKKVDPSKGQFPIDATYVAEQANKAREALQQFGDRSVESVARVTEQFNEQPRLLDLAARKTRELDATIADLQKLKPPGFEKTIADAQAAKTVIEQSLLRPFQEMEEASQRRGQIAQLTAEGLGTEASVLQAIWQTEERLGPLTSDRAKKVREIVVNEAKQLANAQAIAAIRSADDDLARLGMELQLIGKSNEARAVTIAQFEAMAVVDQNPGMSPEKAKELVASFVDRAKAQLEVNDATQAYNDALTLTADKWDIIAGKVQFAGRGMADAFGDAGRAIGDLASVYADYHASRERAAVEHDEQIRRAGKNEKLLAQENARFALRSSGAQIQAFGDMSAAAKGFFKDGSTGYQVLAGAEKAFRTVEFALSVRAMAQDAAETASSIAKSGARTAVKAVEAVVSAISSLPFPLNIAAGAATIGALASIGVAIAGSFGGGGKNNLTKANDGTGTVLGDSTAKSESIKRSIDALKEVDTVMLTYSRQMAASLQSIDSQIGGFTRLVLRAGNVDASAGVNEGFNSSLSGGMGKAYTTMVGFALGGPIGAAIGAFASKIPILGGILKGIGGVVSSLFGTKTKIIGGGLYGGSQTLGSVLSGGFDADYYSDVEKKKKFFGLTTSTKYKTQYTDADPGLENQFTLILRGFNDAIVSAAKPLGESTDAIKNKLAGFVIDIGKIDLKDLTGEEIEEKLNAVFGAAADNMAKAAFPGIEKFQKVGEGLFETLVRVSSTVESVTATMGLLGSSAASMSIDVKMALADQFQSVSDFTSAAGAYFEAYYSKEEQVAARTGQFTQVFADLGMAMPGSLAAFRSLVEAQDLTTAAGQATYSTLLQLAPAFADLQSAMTGAKSAADILSEQQDLQRQLLELQGDTAAIRALDLAKIDPSNRALQEQIWALQDAKEAAAAAEQLRNAWKSVGVSIMDEVNRIRGITDGTGTGSFALLMGQFNAATAAARAGDQDAAGKLVGLSQALLTVAGDTATSKQELDRVKAQIAASLEGTNALIAAITGANTTSPTAALDTAATAVQAVGSPATPYDDVVTELKALRAELAQARTENNAGHAVNASANTRTADKLDDVTEASGGNAITVFGAAA